MISEAYIQKPNTILANTEPERSVQENCHTTL